MGYSIALRDDFLNWFRGTAFPTVPASFYIALLTTNPTDETGTGLVEVSTTTWSNYARQAIANTTAGWAAVNGGTANPQIISNAAALNYGTVTSSANVTVTGIAIYDAATAGVFWGWVALGTSQVISNGNTVSFAVGALQLEM